MCIYSNLNPREVVEMGLFSPPLGIFLLSGVEVITAVAAILWLRKISHSLVYKLQDMEDRSFTSAATCLFCLN